MALPERPALNGQTNGDLAQWALDVDSALDGCAYTITQIRSWADAPLGDTD